MGMMTEDDVSGLQRVVPTVGTMYLVQSPARASVGVSRPGGGQDVAAKTPMYRSWTRLADIVGRGYNKTHVSLTVISHITHVNVQVSLDCDRVQTLSSLTVTLHVSTYKCHTTVTESKHCHLSLSHYTCQRTSVTRL